MDNIPVPAKNIINRFLQQLVDEIGIEIRVAHNPAYCSKYNPIEHRLFPHVTRACQGGVFGSIDFDSILPKWNYRAVPQNA
ncbi:MAG: hypothetical protein WCH01_16005 [Methylococcaceae bacterium]